ncbi:hypothetical protein J1G35_02030, partial [Pseudomonas sp. SH10-3B]|uniref:hypothetical protein n=1 Tax=Pseudomonas sp. SH10-3B TaxID=2816049 RepID=UPI001CA780C7
MRFIASFFACKPTALDVMFGQITQDTFRPPKTKPHLLSQMGFRNLILTMTYSHMGKPHTTIGDAS